MGRVCPDENLERITGWGWVVGNFRCYVALFGKDLFCSVVSVLASGFACLLACTQVSSIFVGLSRLEHLRSRERTTPFLRQSEDSLGPQRRPGHAGWTFGKLLHHQDLGGSTAARRCGCLRRMWRLRSPRWTKSLVHDGQGSAVPRWSFWWRRRESRHRNVFPHSPQAWHPALRWSRLPLETATATAAGEEFVSEGSQQA